MLTRDSGGRLLVDYTSLLCEHRQEPSAPCSSNVCSCCRPIPRLGNPSAPMSPRGSLRTDDKLRLPTLSPSKGGHSYEGERLRHAPCGEGRRVAFGHADSRALPRRVDCLRAFNQVPWRSHHRVEAWTPSALMGVANPQLLDRPRTLGSRRPIPMGGRYQAADLCRQSGRCSKPKTVMAEARLRSRPAPNSRQTPIDAKSLSTRHQFGSETNQSKLTPPKRVQSPPKPIILI